jgi:hypothetical protein
MPDFKPIPHPKDVLIKEPVNGVDQADANQDLIEPHSDNTSVFELQRHLLANADRLNVVQIFTRGIIWLIILFTGYTVFQYKLESSAIGFCDAGSNTSRALRELLAKHFATDECIGETAEHTLEVEQGMISDPCPLRPLFSLPRPKSCSPCPEHASCGQFKVNCDSGYLIQPTILFSFIPVKPSSSELSTKHASYLAELFFQAVSTLTDGLPGLGSVGLPPRCAEDPQQCRNIGSLGKAIESTLAKERGRRVCLGNSFDDKISQEDGIRWGVEVERLKEVFRRKTTVCSLVFLSCVFDVSLSVQPSLLPMFDDMFIEAIRQLVQWGGIFVDEFSESVPFNLYLIISNMN